MKGIRFVGGLLVLVLLLSVAVVASAQSEDDGRLNFNYWMDGFGLYCVNAAKQPSSYISHGGGFLLLLNGEEVMFIDETTIFAKIAEAEETGVYATLGVAVDAYYNPDPAIYYLPETDEFQINIAKSSIDDLREGKLYTFFWKGCRA